MTELPRGTVAFLMSDIEGSTRLVRGLGADFPALLSQHFALLGEAVAANGGTLVSSEGDSIFAVFPSVREGVAAAIAGQLALAAHTWGAGADVRVRMGIHAGEAVFGGRDYTGLDVHRTARIMAAGHGGQILLSDAARALAGDDATVRDMGAHQLRDMPGPDRLFQLLAPGLPADFPPLRTAAPATPTNLPASMTRFIGRTTELAEIGALIRSQRLVTLTGPGGTGKTRLALETARASLADFPEGVWFVPLEVVRERNLAMPAVATAIGAPDLPGQPAAAAVAAFLGTKRVLLVLDNFEQVIAAAADVGALLAGASGTTILVTSREALAIAGERQYPVPPLAVPDEPGSPSAAAIGSNECVALFVERAQASRPDFQLSNANAAAVAAICRRLDGLPLALELAAARCNVLSPDQILSRMDHRLNLLASTRRDLTDRQRTLRGAIDWSYELLTPAEQAFFRRLSVFSGGADFEAIEAIVDPAGELGGDPLDLSAALVDRSLLRSRPGDTNNRLSMLETLREYAGERLAESAPEQDAVRARHIAYFAGLAEGAEGVLTDPARDSILDRLDRELPNIREAVSAAREEGDLTTGARIAVALRDFWHIRNHLTEGRLVLAALLAAGLPDASIIAGRVLLAAAELASWQTDYAESHRLATQAHAMAEASGDLGLRAAAEQGLGWSTFESDPAYARDRFAAAVRLAREANNVHLRRGALQGLSITLFRLGQFAEARTTVDEAIELAESSGDRYINSFNLMTRGFLVATMGDRAGSLRDFRRGIEAAQQAGALVAIGLGLDAFATDAAMHGDPVRAATLAGGALRIREELGGAPSVSLGGFVAPLDEARAVLPAADYERAVAAGRAMPVDDLIALARSEG